MKINDKILSIPPYISTSWGNIRTLHMKGNLLAVTLVDGDSINIPGLTPESIESIFEAHISHIESKPEPTQNKSIPSFLQGIVNEDTMVTQFRIGISGMDGLGAALQHNPAQANAPDLPSEVLQKIQAIAKIVAPDEALVTPKPEPHCNCFHCQIARALLHEVIEEEPYHEMKNQEIVTEEDLTFQQWEVVQTGDKIFTVVNRLDTNEKYNVCLDPIGCTCGQADCEHIVAVLKS